MGLLIIIILLVVVIVSLLIYFENQKKRNFISDAKNYISQLRAKASEDSIVLPDTYKDRIIFSVSQINPDGELDKSSFGGKWIIEKSYIIIRNSGTEYNPIYDYYIALEDDKGNCIELTEESKLHRNLVTKGCRINQYSETKDAYIE